MGEFDPYDPLWLKDMLVDLQPQARGHYGHPKSRSPFSNRETARRCGLSYVERRWRDKEAAKNNAYLAARGGTAA